MDKPKLVDLDLERDLVPLALQTSQELMTEADNKTRSEVAKDILNRSSKYAPKKDGSPSVTINLDAKTFSDAVTTLGSMMGVSRKEIPVENPEVVVPTEKKIVSFEEIEG